MIMRFRPANISLINRRHYLPRLLLTLFSKRQIQKPHQRFEDVDKVTPYQGRFADRLEVGRSVNTTVLVESNRAIAVSSIRNPRLTRTQRSNDRSISFDSPDLFCIDPERDIVEQVAAKGRPQEGFTGKGEKV
jgi:hypothetical protein